MTDSGRPAERRLTSDVPDSLATRLILSGIVIVSITLALTWLFLVPFFQEPDENSHFDYAYQLYSVGRPYRVEQATCARDVTPTVRYLERRSDFYGVRFLSDARVPRGYGKAQFFRSVDAGAPPRISHVPPPGSPAPCVMFTYPAGFYALVAGAIALAGGVWNGSLVAELFAARAIGIVCLAATLPFAYRLLRASRLRTRDALLATAAIGFFPMTSWVSAYIQPDNVTFTCVTLALLTALRLKRHPSDPVAAIALGAILAILFFVKPQYAGVLYVVCAPLVISTLSRRAIAPLRRAFSLLVTCVLPLAALRASTYATPVGRLRIPAHLAPTAAAPPALDPLNSVIETLAYAARTSGEAYASGLPFHRFWNGFGWTDIPYFGNALVADTFEVILGAASLIVCTCFIAGQCNVWKRLARVGVRSPARAFRLLFGDVVLNTYVAWTMLLIFVCAASRGTWSLQGRYWLPVMVPMMAILVTRMPRVLPIRLRARAATVAAVAMLSYASIAAPVALFAAHARYYGSARALSRVSVVALDGVGFFGQGRAKKVITVPRGRDVTLRGFAFGATDGTALDRVDLRIDRQRPIAARYGFAVGTAIAPMPIGFQATIPTRNLAVGEHPVTLSAYRDARSVDRWTDDVSLEIVPNPALKTR